MKKSMKSIYALMLTVVLALTTLAGCTTTDSAAGTTDTPANTDTTVTDTADAGSDTTADSGTAGEPEKVVFWYNHQGEEADIYEEVIRQYNESQDKYLVEGLSVTDKQKVIVAMSGNESPDLIEGSNQDVISFQAAGLIENISAYADRDAYDLNVFAPLTLEANTFGGSLYALPTSSIVIQMFYNKDILEEIGYTDPPETMEELYEMAVKATVLDADGNIERLGYPLFPLASARQELIYAFGGRWWADDLTTLTPTDQGVLDSLNMNVKYRELYGIDKVNAFIATANTNRYSEQDMFFNGKQLFRFDGVWLPTMMEGFGSTVNYGVTLIPGTEADPGQRGSSRFETNSIFIPVVAANKEGAWEFAKALANSELTKYLVDKMGNLPAPTALWDDPDIAGKPGYEGFIDALKAGNGIQYATIADFAEYTALTNEYLDYVYAGMQTPEEAMNNLKAQSDALK